MNLGLASADMQVDVVHNPVYQALARIGFEYEIELVDAHGNVLSTQRAKNLYTTEGLNHLLGVELAAVAQISSWYLALFEGNYTPTTADTGAAISAASTETNAFSNPTVRPPWTPSAAAANGTINNYNNKAAFTFTATKTIYGGFLISTSQVGSTTGVCISAVRFDSPVVVNTGSVINVGAGCTLASA